MNTEILIWLLLISRSNWLLITTAKLLTFLMDQLVHCHGRGWVLFKRETLVYSIFYAFSQIISSRNTPMLHLIVFQFPWEYLSHVTRTQITKCSKEVALAFTIRQAAFASWEHQVSLNFLFTSCTCHNWMASALVSGLGFPTLQHLTTLWWLCGSICTKFHPVLGYLFPNVLDLSNLGNERKMQCLGCDLPFQRFL